VQFWLLSCNFASLCVLAASGIRVFFLAGIFFHCAFYNAFVFSATLQTFCCHITEINFFTDVCPFPVYISFVCVHYPRLNDGLQPLLQALINSFNNLQKKSLLHSVIIYSLVIDLCFACQLSRTYPRLFLERGHSYIVDTLVL